MKSRWSWRWDDGVLGRQQLHIPFVLTVDKLELTHMYGSGTGSPDVKPHQMLLQQQTHGSLLGDDLGPPGDHYGSLGPAPSQSPLLPSTSLLNRHISKWVQWTVKLCALLPLFWCLFLYTKRRHHARSELLIQKTLAVLPDRATVPCLKDKRK